MFKEFLDFKMAIESKCFKMLKKNWIKIMFLNLFRIREVFFSFELRDLLVYFTKDSVIKSSSSGHRSSRRLEPPPPPHPSKISRYQSESTTQTSDFGKIYHSIKNKFNFQTFTAIITKTKHSREKTICIKNKENFMT